MKRRTKVLFIVSAVMILIWWILGIVAVIYFEEAQDSPFFNIVLTGVLVIPMLIWAISLAKVKSRIPVVYEPERYQFCPNNKKKLSLRETMYYMRDKLILKIFYGVVLLMWLFAVFAIQFAFVSIEGATMTDIIAMNICMVLSFVMITGIYGLILFVTRRADITPILLKNTKEYLEVSENDFCNMVEEDLYKGLRFRSKKLVLSEQYIIGTVSKIALSPVAIPISQVRMIRYKVRFYGLPSGKRYMEAKFYFDLKNGKTVLLYINYIKWEIVVQMFKYFGFQIQNITN